MNLDYGSDDRLCQFVEISGPGRSGLQELSQRGVEDFALCETLRALR
jgi:hypothetical protein